MKKVFRKAFWVIITIGVITSIFGLILAFLPTQPKVSNAGITPKEATNLRRKYTGAHHQFTTTDGETLFLRRWNPDNVMQSKRTLLC